MNDSTPEPLHDLIKSIRQPATMRELMASCLRSIYMGDPFTGDGKKLSRPPAFLSQDIEKSEKFYDGIRCSVYAPKNQESTSIILYMHGGGFVIGCSEDTDYIARVLSHSNLARVVSVNYRLAPETAFPGAIDDCEKVLNHLVEELLASEDKVSIYLAGDSAGGNLAPTLYLKLRGIGRHEQINGLILLAPWLDMDVESYDSYNRLAPGGVVFDAPFIGYARACYAAFEEWKNPLVSPIYADCKELPHTIMIIGAEDPFVDQVIKFQKQSNDSSCGQIDIRIFPGMPHCFYSFPNLYREEAECFALIQKFIDESSKRSKQTT